MNAVLAAVGQSLPAASYVISDQELMSIQIFIPTFNRAAKLERAISSALAQTWRELEVVVLDNHSTDDTEKVVRSFMDIDDRITYIKRDINIGMIANFNSIADHVTGDYFAILPDDDEYESCFLEVAIAFFSKYEKIEFVACNALTKVGEIFVKSQLDYWGEGYYRANTATMRCLLGHYPIITNCLFRANLRKKLYFHPELGNTGDGFILTCLFAKYDAYVTKRVTGFWSNDGENASSLQKFNPISIVNVAISEYALYREVCRRGEFSRKWLFLVLLKRDLTILLASDKAGFNHVFAHSCMQRELRRSSVWLLRFLHAVRLGRAFLWGLAMLRRHYHRYISWCEKRREKCY